MMDVELVHQLQLVPHVVEHTIKMLKISVKVVYQIVWYVVMLTLVIHG